MPPIPVDSYTGVNFPADGTLQRNPSIYVNGPGGSTLWGDQSNPRVMLARMGVRSASGGETAHFWSPVVDDNMGLFIENPSNDAGTITTVGTAVTGSGTAFAAGDVDKLLLVAGGASIRGQANRITARASNTAVTLQEAYSSDIGAGVAYKLLAKILQRSNGLAQVRVDDIASVTFVVGDSVLWLFYNNNGNTQAALKVYTDLFEVTGLTFYDVGKEAWSS